MCYVPRGREDGGVQVELNTLSDGVFELDLGTENVGSVPALGDGETCFSKVPKKA
jgi:hypothetical protein